MLSSSTPSYKFKVVMFTLTSLIRLAFIFTFYKYEAEGHPSIINLVHHDLVGLFLIFWLFEFLHDVVVVLFDMIGMTNWGVKKKKKGSSKKG